MGPQELWRGVRWLIPEVLQEAKEQDRLDLACAWLLRCWRPQGEGLPLGQRVGREVQAPSLLPPPVSSPHAPHRQGLRGLPQSSGTGSLVLGRTPRSRLRLEPGERG